MARRLQLVVNPAAGGGRATKLLPSVEAALRGAGHDLVVSPTTSLEHADELADAAIADDRVVVAMGGDGIVGRVAGRVAAGGGVLGVVPGGRGNDFCRGVGLPGQAVAACEVLATGEERRIDLGYAGDMPFLCVASFGFDSDVQERVLRSRLPLGPFIYLYGALATVAGWKPATFSCSVDGELIVVTGWSVAVANSGVYGGGMRLAPDASVEDGLLDVVTTSTTTRSRFLRALPKLYKGAHLDEPSVSVRTARSVDLSADRPFRVFADGDPIASLPCTISVRPGVLRVLLPVRP
ncbi:MAG: diacylglycerol kinase family lipid kinase [Frankiaceae bacterium]|nr:diacylglycerol kinase family lipid kinase [Frankiaceae bacterium]